MQKNVRKIEFNVCIFVPHNWSTKLIAGIIFEGLTYWFAHHNIKLKIKNVKVSLKVTSDLRSHGKYIPVSKKAA